MEDDYSDVNQYLRIILNSELRIVPSIKSQQYRRPCWGLLRDPFTSGPNPYTAGLRYLEYYLSPIHGQFALAWPQLHLYHTKYLSER